MKVLVAYPTRPSFVARDIKILASQHQVTEHQFFSLRPGNLFVGIRRLTQSDLLFLWFASIRAIPLVLAAALLRKKIIVVVGGYEAANCPEIEYGSARSPWQRRLTRLLLARADSILAVSRSSRDEIISNLGIAPERITTISHGFEPIQPITSERRNSVLTVGLLADRTWVRKGVVDFVRCAEQLPEIPFIHVGDAPLNVREVWGKPLPVNLKICGRISDADLIREMCSAKVYLQLSRHEAFGCSVAEAMLCGCVPVVSDRYALPQVVGSAGRIVNPDRIDEAVNALRLALASDPSSGAAARERIRSEFPYEKRERAILESVTSLLSKG